jgi:hypothetical protein
VGVLLLAGLCKACMLGQAAARAHTHHDGLLRLVCAAGAKGHTWQDCRLAARDSEQMKLLPWERSAARASATTAAAAPAALATPAADDVVQAGGQRSTTPPVGACNGSQQQQQQQQQQGGGEQKQAAQQQQRTRNRFDLLNA